MKKKIRNLVKKEIVTVVCFALAIVSMFIVPPDAEYAGYIHWSTLSILMCLMIVMSGLQSLGVFKYLGRVLLSRRNHARSVMLLLVGLCFFLSPFITNDVALITFVPFTVFVLEYAGLKKYIIPTLTLQTIAANMGSMITPVGNPQNIFLFECMQETGELSSTDFIVQMLPYYLISAVLMTVFVFVIARRNEAILKRKFDQEMHFTGKMMSRISMYYVLFIVSLLPVFGFVKYYYVLPFVLAAVAIFDRGTLLRTNYSLLFTFLFLFVVVGNLGRIDAICNALTAVAAGNELIVSLLASQIISNAPAAILLSGFTDKYFLLALGTDLGGLGTLIASLANLISFKEYSEMKDARVGRYILVFTAINVLFLVIMIVFATIVLE